MGVKISLYVLAAVTCLTCTFLLVRQYLQVRSRLLFGSALCFVCLSASNIIMFFDLAIYPGPAVDLRLYRLLTALAGMIFLLYGFIMDAE